MPPWPVELPYVPLGPRKHMQCQAGKWLWWPLKGCHVILSGHCCARAIHPHPARQVAKVWLFAWLSLYPTNHLPVTGELIPHHLPATGAVGEDRRVTIWLPSCLSHPFITQLPSYSASHLPGGGFWMESSSLKCYFQRAVLDFSPLDQGLSNIRRRLCCLLQTCMWSWLLSLYWPSADHLATLPDM